MSFSIVKVKSSLNYSIIGLKIKHIQGGIIDKMAEIQLNIIMKIEKRVTDIIY